MVAKARLLSILFLLSAGALTMVVPFVWMLLSAFKPNQEILHIPPTILPEVWTLDNFRRVLFEIDFASFFANSLLLATLKTAIIVYTSALAGYLLSKFHFPGQRWLFYLILATMMAPWPVTIIAQYQQMVWLGWIDHYAALVVPFLMNSFGVFLMRQFMMGIPSELIDAARVDGASEFRIFHWIALPLSVPALSALGIFIFLWSWDDFLWPYLMISRQEDYVLPVGLSLLQGRFETDYGAIFAGMSITIVPVLLVYAILQRKFIEGMTFSGGVKG